MESFSDTKWIRQWQFALKNGITLTGNGCDMVDTCGGMWKECEYGSILQYGRYGTTKTCAGTWNCLDLGNELRYDENMCWNIEGMRLWKCSETWKR